MDQENVIYMYMNFTQPFKKKEISPFVTVWMDLEGIMLSEMSEKDKYHMISLNEESGGKKKNNLSSQIQRTDWWLPEARDGGWAK